MFIEEATAACFQPRNSRTLRILDSIVVIMVWFLVLVCFINAFACILPTECQTVPTLRAKTTKRLLGLGFTVLALQVAVCEPIQNPTKMERRFVKMERLEGILKISDFGLNPKS